ncbi:MAG: purine-nucleoside phosphorylase [bacterium P3]|nr:MAG: purine-nucleoside phosphorylase [bacterium P3]KWW42745.1 MAG: purine-nucleoside phosphorylase [bacterium F083]
MQERAFVQMIDEAAEYVRGCCKAAQCELPTTGIVLGSGLGGLAERIAKPLTIPYSTIPHFKQSTATGHKGNLIVGTLGGEPMVAMQGRFHYYEGYSMQEVTMPVRVMAKLGVATLYVSNAAGGMNPAFKVGDLMVITDHINFMPNPLIGANLDDFGVRFPDMTEVYSRRLRQRAHRIAEARGVVLHEGVYVAETGPSYETLAEYRMYSLMGGDAVGMSTTPEVIVARHCGLEVFGISIITNQANDLRDGARNDGDDVVAAAQAATQTLSGLIEAMIADHTNI